MASDSEPLLPWTGERYVPQVRGGIALEHLHRYAYACDYVIDQVVLDIASGEGYGCDMLSRRAKQVFGVDNNREAVEHAASKYLSSNIQFMVGTCENIPLKSGQVDVVVSFETIEHISDHDAFMCEIKRVLKPGGVLIISSPEKNKYDESLSEPNPYHIKELNYDDFRSLLEHHFSHVKLLGQKLAAGSEINGLRDPLKQNAVFEFAKLPKDLSKNSLLLAPIYLLGVCSDKNDFLPLSSFCVQQAWETDYARYQNSKIEHLTGMVAERDDRIAALTEQVTLLGDALALRMSRLERYEQQIKSIKASVSWRLTRPLRSAVKWLQSRGYLVCHSNIATQANANEARKEGFEEISSFARLRRAVLSPIRIWRAQIIYSGGERAAIRYVYNRVLELGIRKTFAMIMVYISGRPVIANALTNVPYFKSSELGLWEKYQSTHDRLFERRVAYACTPPPILSINKQNLPRSVEQLNFKPCNEPVISIIVPVYNNISLTVECMLSIQDANQKQLPLSMHVIDAASTDETQAVLSRLNGIEYARLEQKSGYVHNCNRGALLASGEYLLFMNNDAQLMPGTFEAMMSVFHQYPDAGIVGPKVIYPSGHLQEAGGRIRSDGSTEMIGLNDDPRLPKYNILREVDYCSGVCLMIPRKLFERLGGFSDEYAPAYFEDVDLCLKARAHGYKVFYQPEAVVVHHLSKSYNDEKLAGKIELTTRNQLQLVDKWESVLSKDEKVKLIAFYLPQYHPIPENDLWWGAGFTEWRNVTAATPAYEGHNQPRFPADLGFYDLRVSQVMENQAALAHRYGIHGFCYYYYWFNGKRLLEKPLERMLADSKPDMPFCICWANENWTRRWDGMDHELLIGQQHSPEDDEKVMLDMIRYMRDRRYIRIDGRPLLVIYRTSLFPDISKTAELWRQICAREGVGEICLASVESFGSNIHMHPARYGFDFTVNFPPHGTPYNNNSSKLKLFRNALVYQYRDMIEHHTNINADHLCRFLGVCPGWDNTPRRKSGSTIFAGSSPGEFQAWLEWAITETKRWHRGDARLVFINAWNEWAEGAVLEPDQQHGTSYLEAARNALFNSSFKH